MQNLQKKHALLEADVQSRLVRNPCFSFYENTLSSISSACQGSYNDFLQRRHGSEVIESTVLASEVCERVFHTPNHRNTPENLLPHPVKTPAYNKGVVTHPVTHPEMFLHAQF